MSKSKKIELLDDVMNDFSARAMGYIETNLTTEFINYRNYGDEVVDESHDVNVIMKIPRLTFLDIVDFLQNLKEKKLSFVHYYKNILIPYDNDVESPGVWGYFDLIKNNTLHSSTGIRTYMSIFYVMEFDMYLVLRITDFDPKYNYLK